MTSYFPDVNTWLALAWEGHVHHTVARAWFESTTATADLIFSRYSQLGLLRLVTNRDVMGDSVLNLREAFALHDSLIQDPRIHLVQESQDLDRLMRTVSRPVATQPATKAIGDLYLIAFAMAAHATLVTFDKAIARAMEAQRSPVVLLTAHLRSPR